MNIKNMEAMKQDIEEEDKNEFDVDVDSKRIEADIKEDVAIALDY